MRFPYVNDFDPPAPMADVEITTNLISTVNLPVEETPVKKVRALLDTGSEISVVPQWLIAEIEEELGDKLTYGFSSVRTLTGQQYRKTCSLQVVDDRHKCFTHSRNIAFVVDEGNVAILGRNFLSAYRLVFDGPSQKWGALPL